RSPAPGSSTSRGTAEFRGRAGPVPHLVSQCGAYAGDARNARAPRPDRTLYLSVVSLRSFRHLLIPLCALMATACSSRQLARTMGEGNGEARVSVGGPFFSNIGSTIPIPNVAVGG